MPHLALLLACAALACGAELDPPATPASASASTSSRDLAASTAPRLNLPALDGTPAPLVAADDPQAPTVHALPDGRRFIHDSHRDRITLEDPRTGERTDLGEAVLLAVPRLGYLIVPKREPATYHDVDPDAPRLRPLWRAPGHPGPTTLVFTELVGLDRGAPLFLVRKRRVGAPSVPLPPFPTVDLVRVAAPGAPEVTTVRVTSDHHAPGDDAVRGRKLVLVGPQRDLPPGAPAAARTRPFTAPVILLDLDSHAVQALGEARGDWTVATAVPHPYLAVRWTDHDPHARDHGWAEACINTVDPHRGLLTACTPRP